MKKILFFLLVSGGAKFVPLLFGALVSKTYGPAAYALLVQILTQSNFLTSLATVSYVQMILSGRSDEDSSAAGNYPLKAICFALVVSVIGAVWSSLGSTQTLLLIFVVMAYSWGNSVLSVGVSQLNAELKNGAAAWMMFQGLVVPYVIGFVLVALGVPYSMSFLVVALLFSLTALILVFRRNRHLPWRHTSRSAVGLFYRSVPLEKDHLLTMVFVGSVFYAHTLLMSRVREANESSSAAVFALGYQLFTMGLFIPNMLGNIVVPRLNRQQNPKTFIKLNSIYGAIGLLWAFAIWLASPLIFKIYHLDQGAAPLRVILPLQIGVFLGSLNALMNAKLIAVRSLIRLSGLAVFYLSIVFVWIQIFGAGVESAAYALPMAYLLVLAADGLLPVSRRLAI